MRGQPFRGLGRDVDAAPFLEALRATGMIGGGVERSDEETGLLEAYRARQGQLTEAATAAAKEKMRDALVRLMPSATVRRQGDEFEVEFKDAMGSNQFITIKITDSTLPETEAGFDLTGFGTAEYAIEAWNELGLDTRPIVSKPRCYVWAGDGLEIVAANNPFEGPKGKEGESALGTQGYLSYVGIRGRSDRVKKAVAAIKKYAKKGDGGHGEFIGGSLPFIGFPEE
jgi:hypothetical protein